MAGKKPLKKKLKPQHQIVVEQVAKGETQTDAYQKAYPLTTRRAARANASRLIANDNISDALQSRISRSLKHHKVTPEEVIGSAVFQMRSSMNDVLDESGSFSIEKARETGAIDLLKKHKETMKSTWNAETKGHDVTRVFEVELLTNQDARKEVANYIGVEKLSPAGLSPEIELAIGFFKLLRTLNYDFETAQAGTLHEYPYIDVELLTDENE